MYKINVLLVLLFSFVGVQQLQAQCVSGTITKAASASYNFLLDPNTDNKITASGAAFTTDTTEMAEFELIPNSTTGWVSLVDISEVDGDINPVCGNSDLITDGNGGDFGYYNIVDPTPGTPTSGDEYIVLRFRLAKSPNGNFGYNFLFDTDNSYGSGVDGNALCGNQGFEREVQFANAGGKKGVSAYSIDGAIALTALSPPCSQCIVLADVQEACAGSSGTCGTSDPVFISFPLPLSHIGVPSDIDPLNFYVALATASSGNSTSVTGGGNVTDLGAIEGQSTGCPACAGLTGCAEFDCQMQCINAAFAALPVEWGDFEVYLNEDKSVQLDWSTYGEFNSDYFVVERSDNSLAFKPIATVYSRGSVSPGILSEYHFTDNQTFNNGTLYYRLRQVDLDGQFSYSQVKSIKIITDNDKWLLSPNPTVSQTIISHQSNISCSYDIQIYHINGQLLQRIQLDGDKGKNEIPIDLEEYLPGTYIVRVLTSYYLGDLSPSIFRLVKL